MIKIYVLFFGQNGTRIIIIVNNFHHMRSNVYALRFSFTPKTLTGMFLDNYFERKNHKNLQNS